MHTHSLRILARNTTIWILSALLTGLVSAVQSPVHAAEKEIPGASVQISRTNAAVFSQLNLYANIETIGVVVNGSNLPKTAQLFYRQDNDPTWHSGHPLLRIDDSRLAGSLFGLSPSTSYTIKVVDGATELSGSITTQADELLFTPSTTLHVNDDAAAGGDGSAGAPFKTIQEGVNRAGPGTQILVADGVYREGVTFPASGTANRWIQVKAEGSGAILDGSDNLSGNIWMPDESRARVWSTKIGAPVGYLARNQQRFFMYDDLVGLREGRGHGRVPMNEGWFFEPNTGKLYVRSLDDPSSHNWQASRIDRAFDADGKDWLWIEGFEIKYYGLDHGCGVCMTNASHIVIRRNKIHNLQLGIFINWTGGETQGNDTRIEYNEIYDPPVNEWPWLAVKGSSMEGTAIVARGHIGTIVRGNDLHNFFNGIYTGSSASLENPGIAFDMDVYNNTIHDISDDGLEPEGASINQRFRNNTIDRMLVGISLAPITQGPVWVMRSVFTNYTSSSIKWDLNSDGAVLFYHNTSWTNVPGLNSMSMIRPVHNAVMRNNIFQGNGYAFEEPFTGSSGHDWNYDNWYTTLGSSGPHFKWENISYSDISKLCAATGLECQGHENAPGLTNPGGGDFSLLSSSPNIDRGVVIQGINENFRGNAPDIGAYEANFNVSPAVLSIKQTDANPTNASIVNFTIDFSEPVTGVDVVSPFKDFGLVVGPGIIGAFISNVTPVSGTTYTVGVNTGTGNGTIRLDLADDDTILDVSGNPLGGAGAGNGNFTTGPVYTIGKNVSLLSSIARADPSPATAGSVRFIATFSGQVSGVDASDFTLAVNGAITGAAISGVTGSGNIYTITVNTGTGDGSLRLDLLDDDSILDSLNLPLGGAGIGNGNFTSGEAYVIDKSVPIVTDSLHADPNPNTADSVRFTLNFSEPVTGVNGNDFVIVTTGGISGVGLIAINGSGNSYSILVNTGIGDGTIRLNLVDNDSIVDALGIPLGGPGMENGNFSTGAEYIINRSSIVKQAQTFLSNGANDGWVLESNENSNQGGSMNSSVTNLNLGDDDRDRQYRAILDFQTASLPDNAVITMAILLIKKQDRVGTDPYHTHQNMLVDIRSGMFGAEALHLADFQNPASRDGVGMILNNPVSGWYWSTLDGTAFPHINLAASTQFRLRFQIDDNDDGGNDYLKFYSGNSASEADRPQLRLEYYVPK